MNMWILSCESQETPLLCCVLSEFIVFFSDEIEITSDEIKIISDKIWKKPDGILKMSEIFSQKSEVGIARFQCPPQFLFEMGWEISLDCRKLCVFLPRTFNTSDLLYCLSYLSFGLPFHQRVTRGCLCASMYLGAPIAVKASCTELWFKAYFLCNSGEGVEELCWMLSKEKPQYLVGVLRLEVIVGCCVCKPKRL